MEETNTNFVCDSNQYLKVENFVEGRDHHVQDPDNVSPYDVDIKPSYISLLAHYVPLLSIALTLLLS